MKEKRLLICICLIFIISLSFISAGFFSDFFDKIYLGGITGDAINGNKIMDDCTNVIALYHLDGDAIDGSWNSNNGVVNGATFNSGRLGQGAVFDGVNDYVRIPYSNLGNSLTYSFWFKRLGEGDQYPFGFMHTKVKINDTQIVWWPDLRLDSKFADWNNNSDWNYLAIAQSGTVCSIYLNDQILVSDSTCNAIFTINYYKDIGRFGLNYFKGSIDEVVIYNRKLTSGEISEIYNSGSAISCLEEPCVNNSDIITCGTDLCGNKTNNCGSLVNCGICNPGYFCNNGICEGQLFSCGNNTIEVGEVCDGTNLSGENCITQGFTGGSLVCGDNCLSFNISGCINTSLVNCADNDGDGYNSTGGSCGLIDCNDGYVNINPGTTEICGNGIDEDCSGSDLSCPKTFHDIDTNKNDCVEQNELDDYLDLWFKGEPGVTNELVTGAIEVWRGC